MSPHKRCILCCKKSTNQSTPGIASKPINLIHSLFSTPTFLCSLCQYTSNLCIVHKEIPTRTLMSYEYDTRMIQCKATNINAFGGHGRSRDIWRLDRIFAWYPRSILRHGEFSTRNGQRLSSLDLLAQASGTQKDMSAGTQLY